MVGACGGQRCLAGDGVLNSSEMPAAKVMLFFFFFSLFLLWMWKLQLSKLPSCHSQGLSLQAARTPHFSIPCCSTSLGTRSCHLQGCWLWQGRAGGGRTGLGAPPRFSPHGKIRSWDNMCRSVAPQPSSGASRAKAGLFQPALEEPLGPTTDTRREWRRWAETGQGRGVGARALPSQQSAAEAQGWRHLQHRVAGRAAPHSSPVQCLKRGLHLPEPSIWHLSRAVNSLKKKKKPTEL